MACAVSILRLQSLVNDPPFFLVVIPFLPSEHALLFYLPCPFFYLFRSRFFVCLQYQAQHEETGECVAMGAAREVVSVHFLTGFDFIMKSTSVRPHARHGPHMFVFHMFMLWMFIICVYMSDMHAFSPHHMPEHSIFNPTDFYLPISPDVACGGLTGRGMAACASYGGGGAPCSDGRCGGPGLGAYLHS